MVRSFLCRRKVKNLERSRFDDHLRRHGLVTLDDLQYLLIRLLFFYEQGVDEQRFITIGQYVLKSSQDLLKQLSNAQSVWQHRINRLLLLSIKQLLSESSHAIPLRLLLELFTNTQGRCDVDSLNVVGNTLSFLVRKGIFRSIRQILETKTPPLDGPTAHPPNPFCDAVLQLVRRPLEFAGTSAVHWYVKLISRGPLILINTPLFQ